MTAKIDLSAVKTQKASIKVIDLDGNDLETKYLFRYVPFTDISSNVVNAFVALEDKRFFTHRGIDPVRTVGALFHNIRSGKLKEGGSTITQQLAKNTLLSSEKTFKRKIKEIRLAREIEKKFSKEEIIEMYLNAIYYGNGIYGIDSAAYTYFGKDASDLSVAEGAILAGIVKNPSLYSPFNHPDEAIGRMKLVLKLMMEQNYIDKTTYNEAISYIYSAPMQENDPVKPYYVNVIHEAAQILGISEKDLIRSPYVIYTYYDKSASDTVYSSFKSGEFISNNQNNVPADYSALLCNNQTSGITAYYSTTDKNIFTFRRSPASCIKPILVYAPALEYGFITEKSIFEDKKTSFNGYSPRNFGDIYYGAVPIETAVSKSINTVAVQVLQLTSLDRAVPLAEQAGLSFDKNDNNLALALGGMTYGSTMTELAEGYMCLANAGKHTNLTFIQSIRTADDTIIYSHNRLQNNVFSPDTAYLMTDMLRKSVMEGTARKLCDIPFEIASKTGTAENVSGSGNSDAWNISYSPDDTLCVWYGDTENTDKSALDITGSTFPTLLAANIRRKLAPPKKKTFDIPPTVNEYEIDKYALSKENALYFSSTHTPAKYREKGFFSVKNCPQTVSKYFDISKIDLKTEITDDSVTFTIRSDMPYRYKLREKNLLSGEITEYEVETADSPIVLHRNKGLLNFRLAVYCENEFLGYTAEKMVFT